jgi:hypothetical protein
MIFKETVQWIKECAMIRDDNWPGIVELKSTLRHEKSSHWSEKKISGNLLYSRSHRWGEHSWNVEYHHCNYPYSSAEIKRRM